MRKLYYYDIYNQMVVSYIKLTELSETHKNSLVDVIIEIAEMPLSIRLLLQSGEQGACKKNEAWFVIPKIASFYITNGNKITIQPDKEMNMNELTSFIIGPCFGYLLFQQGKLPIYDGVDMLEILPKTIKNLEYIVN